MFGSWELGKKKKGLRNEALLAALHPWVSLTSWLALVLWVSLEYWLAPSPWVTHDEWLTHSPWVSRVCWLSPPLIIMPVRPFLLEVFLGRHPANFRVEYNLGS